MSEAGEAAGSGEPESYRVRVTVRARRDIDAATVRLAEAVSPAAAVAWHEGLYEALAGLATLPRRHPIAPDPFPTEVRQLLYRRAGSNVTYRVFFAVSGEAPDTLDAPTVTILHVRHGSMRPLTAKEARQIGSEAAEGEGGVNG